MIAFFLFNVKYNPIKPAVYCFVLYILLFRNREQKKNPILKEEEQMEASEKFKLSDVANTLLKDIYMTLELTPKTTIIDEE